jgi:hypothetical protein
MSAEAAGTMAEALPALLVVGLLAPWLLKHRLFHELEHRVFVLNWVIVTVVAEGFCCVAVMTDSAVPLVGAFFVGFAVGGTLAAILAAAWLWATRGVVWRWRSRKDDADGRG